jgi:hypothetical protein
VSGSGKAAFHKMAMEAAVLSASPAPQAYSAQLIADLELPQAKIEAAEEAIPPCMSALPCQTT